MLKKTITYTDYNGVERTEDHYFNLSKPEITEIELGTDGGFAETLSKIIAAKDGASIYRNFKKIILLAYGEKVDDGKRFKKSSDMSEAFSQTEAFSVLLTELSTDADSAVNFVKGVIPEYIDSEENKTKKR